MEMYNFTFFEIHYNTMEIADVSDKFEYLIQYNVLHYTLMYYIIH